MAEINFTNPEFPNNWERKKVNDIENNPLECYYLRVHLSENSDRIFRIYPQYRAVPNCYGGMQILGEKEEFAEYWILTEQIAFRKNSEWTYDTETIIRIFTDLDEANSNAISL